jgi:hypothetical protein
MIGRRNSLCHHKYDPKVRVKNGGPFCLTTFYVDKITVDNCEIALSCLLAWNGRHGMQLDAVACLALLAGPYQKSSWSTHKLRPYASQQLFTVYSPE